MNIYKLDLDTNINTNDLLVPLPTKKTLSKEPALEGDEWVNCWGTLTGEASFMFIIKNPTGGITYIYFYASNFIISQHSHSSSSSIQSFHIDFDII